MPEHPDRPQAVVLSSDTAFLDEWNPQGSGGSGALIYAPGEPRGSFAAMAVATPGRGRVAVLGDHNAFSNIFLHYADNFRLALQTWDWLAHHRLGVKPGYDGRQLSLKTDSGLVPVAIEIAPRVQLLLQATMVRNDAFRAVDGGLMSIAPCLRTRTECSSSKRSGAGSTSGFREVDLDQRQRGRSARSIVFR